MAFPLEPIQANYTAGELDPQLTAREDADLYYTGAERMRNVLLTPHGGYTRRPGLLYRDEIPGVLAQIDLSGATITAPNGGTAANATDGDDATLVTTTVNLSTTTPYVVLHVDLGASASDLIRFVDVRNLSLDGSADIVISDEFRVQWSDDNSAWTDLEAAFEFVTQEDSRWNYRRAFTTPAFHRYWRVVRVGSTDGGTRKVELGEFLMWSDASPATLSANRQIQFEAGALQTYTLVATDRNIRVYKDGIRQADVSMPHTAAQLVTLSWTQSNDTLLLFHENVQTHLIRRLGSDASWRDQVQAFSNIPTLDFNDTVGSGAEPVWSATRGWPRCGAFFKGRLYMGGTPFLTGTFWASAAKGDLFDFDVGTGAADDSFSGEVTTDEAAAIYSFVSADFLFIITSSGAFFLLPRDDPPTPDNFNVSRIRGKKRARGPGFPSFQLDTGVVFLDDSGEQVNEIREEVFRGRFEVNNLAFLAPHLIRDPQDMALRRALSTDRGDLLFLVNDDGGLAVMQTLRNRDFTGWTGWHTGATAGDTLQGLFQTVGTQIGGIEGRYFAVVERIIGGVKRRYFEEFLDTVFLDSAVQTTATFKSFTATAGQSVFSYSFTSPAAAADLSVRLDDVLLDITDDYTVDLVGKTVTLTPATAATVAAGATLRIAIKITEITGLDHLEGEAVRTRVDDAVGSTLTVSGGKVTLADFCDDNCEAGLDWPDCKEIVVNELKTRSVNPLTDEEARFQVYKQSDGTGAGDGVWVLDMPVAVPPGGQVATVRGKKKRVNGAVVTVSNTQGFYFGANGTAARGIVFSELGDFLLDRRPPLRTGQVKLYGLKGWTFDGQTEITQRDPVPMFIMSVVRGVTVAD